MVILLVPFQAQAQRRANTARVADQLLLTAVDQLENQQGQQAYNTLRQAEQIDQSNDAVKYYIGNILSMAGQVDSAYEYYRKAAQIDSTNIWYQMRMAACLNQLRRPYDALAIYRKLLTTRGNDTNVISSALDSYIMVSEYEKADSLINRLETIEGVTDFSSLSRLELLRQKGEFTAFFTQLADYFRTGSMTAEGKVDLMRKVMRTSDPRFNYMHLSDYLSLSDLCLELHPADTSVTHYAVGLLYTAEKNKELLKLCNENSSDPYMVRAAAAVYEIEKNYKACIKELDKLISVCGGDTTYLSVAHTTKGDCYQQMGNMQKAFAEYDIALKLTPNDLSTLNNYAYYMACEGKNLAKCAKMSRKTIEAEPENPTFLDTYAWILYKQKKYQLAKAYFKKALLYGGKDSSVLLDHYAATLEALGETTLAKAYREQAAVKRDAKK